ncbi:MAG: UDP-glucose--hexose-1-phosphate uridylyltransferase [Gammaproteobacteria bacterium]|nr:UDP-glucose--hexose-1-phosphate uridylyltransferase [Gammaproteobacteria bacterium]
MTVDDTESGVHRRFDLLQGEWVLVSPHRDRRPWQGQVEVPEPLLSTHDPDCHLCPGNRRANGARNPDYAGVFVFDNDFPALLDGAPEVSAAAGMFRSEPVRGRCRVLCYSPRHDQSLARLGESGLSAVVAAWQRETIDLGARWRWVQCFENRGASMGCSSPHPHGQIWTMDALPTLVRREREQQRQYLDEWGRGLLLDVVAAEAEAGTRVVIDDRDWLVVVPYWARWPFETLILPRRPMPGLAWMGDAEAASLAGVLGDLFRAYDNLFRCAFPYSFGWHGLPGARQSDVAGWQLHGHCYPPLLRSAGIRKFMVGFEMLAEAQRDITPETAAARLRAARGPHWQTTTDTR